MKSVATQDVTRFAAVPDEKNEDGRIRSYTINFNVMDEGDGMTGQIILEGNPYANFGMIGSVEGVKSFSNADTFRLKRLGLYALVMAVIITAAGFLWFLLSRKPVKGIDLRMLDKPTLKRFFLLTALFIVTLAACGIVVFYMAQIPNSKVLDYVPQAIAPSNSAR